MTRFDRLHESLSVLRDTVPRAVRLVGAESEAGLESWTRALDTRILPRLAPGCPLLAAICGGGSTGKSTLFNTLLDADLSPAGGKAGINRRVLVAAHPEVVAGESLLSNLFEPFGDSPKPLANKRQLGEPGCPLYVSREALPRDVVLLDTPDFDTGSGGRYVNRPLARPVLEACDVLIYVFTNATYNNLDSTQFMSETLAGVGRRQCILVYRCYSSFTDDEVGEHSGTVIRNLYGEDAGDYVLGIYRVHESNDVAAGRQRMDVVPFPGGDCGILELLARLDPRETREKINRSIVADVLDRAEGLCEAAAVSLDRLALYRDMIRLAQSHSVPVALKHFPTHEIAGRVNRIWRETSPGHVKTVRAIGDAAAYPGRKVLALARWIGKRTPGEKESREAVDPNRNVKEDLVAAAGELRRKAIAGELSGETLESDPDGIRLRELVERIHDRRPRSPEGRPYVESGAGRLTIYVEAHPALDDIREDVRRRSWSEDSESIARLAGEICRPPETFDDELRELVAGARSEMKFQEKVREYVGAYLGVIPPTLALVYIFGTGDVAVGAGVHAKLSGLFGLHDLAAVVALPASTGLDMASRKKLEERLKPLVERWFGAMAKRVEETFCEQITGGLLDEAARRVGEVEDLLESAETEIRNCRSAGVE